MKIYFFLIGLTISILSITGIVWYIVKNEHLKQELQQQNIILEINNKTLEKDLQDQQKILKVIYENNNEHKKQINKKSKTLKLSAIIPYKQISTTINNEFKHFASYDDEK